VIDNPKPGKTSRSRLTIGFLLHTIEDAYGAALWAGAMDAARAQDANLICYLGRHLSSPHGFEAQSNVLYRLVDAESVDGLVLSSSSLGMHVGMDAVKGFFERYRPLPMVSLALPIDTIPSVLVDNVQGMREVVIHLIETHGFRRIAFISGPPKNPEAVARYQAYADVLTESGLPLDLPLVSPPTEWNENTGRNALSVLLDERGLQPGVDFEAIVGSNDEVALGALAELRARGVHVPHDVTVTGFDGLEKGEYVTPPLTTVRQPIYEQAYLAVEMIVAQLRGEEVPNQNHLSTELVVRQSCGCPDRVVVQAAVGPVDLPQKKAAASETFPQALTVRREHICEEMTQAAGASSEGIEPTWADQLLQTFSDDVEGKSSGAFLRALDTVVRQVSANDRDVNAWQGVISALRRPIVPCLAEMEHLHRAEDLWQQARALIAEATCRSQAFREARTKQQADRLRQIGQTLLTTFDLTSAMDVLTRRLPELGFPACFLSLYDFPEQPETWSNLIFAYNEKQRIDIPPGGLRFRSRQLVPRDLLPANGPFSAVIVALHFRDQQLGFVVFEAGPLDGAIYESLRGQISSVLQGALLMQQVQYHTMQLDTVVTETLATSEEMRVTISETARQAQGVADAAQRSVDVSRTGQDAVTDTLAGMDTIRGQVEDIAQSILALSERTQQIGEIINVVKDIADQSRLLALNASIEAARAGDEGLGFAVVAREMRHLAGQSREATTRVSNILNEIQQAANTAVMVTEEGSKGAQSGMELASRAGEAIRDLAAIIEEAARVAIQIAASTHQQTNAMNQLVGAMQSIKQASLRTTVSFKEAGLSADEE
jgi:DNA-binding LacI/PurR family transcriptional regulator